MGRATATMSLKVNTTVMMPVVGFGMGIMGTEPGVIQNVVKTAIKVGYRHFDCSKVYENEEEIGLAIKEMIQKNVVNRENLWITSKLWCTDHAPEDVPQALNSTLQAMQLDYLDLYLIQWPIRFKKGTKGIDPAGFAPLDIRSTWEAMEKLLDTGKVRAIGVSNFSIKKLEDLLTYANIVPAVNEVECHPMWQQTNLKNFCKKHDIQILAYCPLGSPNYPFGKVDVLEHPVVKQVAESLGKSPAQVVLRWGLQSGHAMLPSSKTKDRIKTNFEIFDWSIPEESMDQFSQIEQIKLIRGEWFVHETYGPYRTLEDLWDGEIVGMSPYSVQRPFGELDYFWDALIKG